VACKNLLVTLEFRLLLVDTCTHSEIIPRRAVNIPFLENFMMLPTGCGRQNYQCRVFLRPSGFALTKQEVEVSLRKRVTHI
jgi:hypothetical protein